MAAEGPVLDTCFLDNTHAVGVGIDATVRVFDLNEPQAPPALLGTHAKPIRCCEYAPQFNTVFTGGWDGKV
jgi:cell cycle arrest protein BUB3